MEMKALYGQHLLMQSKTPKGRRYEHATTFIGDI